MYLLMFWQILFETAFCVSIESEVALFIYLFIYPFSALAVSVLFSTVV